MKNQLTQLIIPLTLGIVSTITLINPGFAQTQTSQDGTYQSNEKDSLYGDSTLGVDPMDLIHNYNLRVGRSADEFNEESGTQIQDSAAEFRRLQQERMLQQYNNAPETTEKITK